MFPTYGNDIQMHASDKLSNWQVLLFLWELTSNVALEPKKTLFLRFR